MLDIKKYRFMALVLIIVLAIGQLFRLDLVKNAETQIDFRNMYVGSSILIQNKNPYSDTLLKNSWEKIASHEKIEKGLNIGLPNMPLLYFPNALVFYSPFLVFNYSLSALINQCITLLLVLGCAFFTIRILSLYHIHLGTFSQITIYATWFASKATVNTINVGQPMWYSLFFCLLACYLFKKSNYIFGALVLSLATIKPTLAIPFFIFLFITENKKWVIISSIISVLFLIIPTLIYNPKLWDLFNGLILQIKGYKEYISSEYTQGFTYSFEVLSNSSWSGIFYFNKNLLFILNAISFLSLMASIFLYSKNKKYELHVLIMIFFVTLGSIHHKYYDTLILLFPVILMIFNAQFYIDFWNKLALSIWFFGALLPIKALERIFQINIPEEWQMVNSYTILLGFIFCAISLVKDTLQSATGKP